MLNSLPSLRTIIGFSKKTGIDQDGNQNKVWHFVGVMPKEVPTMRNKGHYVDEEKKHLKITTGFVLLSHPTYFYKVPTLAQTSCLKYVYTTKADTV